MGLQQFSMDAIAILEVKRQIRLTDTTRLSAQVEALLQQAEPEQIRRAVDEINAVKNPLVFFPFMLRCTASLIQLRTYVRALPKEKILR